MFDSSITGQQRYLLAAIYSWAPRELLFVITVWSEHVCMLLIFSRHALLQA